MMELLYLSGMLWPMLLFLLLLAILWLLVPFAIFGIKPILRDLLKEQKRSNELLVLLGKATERQEEILRNGVK